MDRSIDALTKSPTSRNNCSPFLSLPKTIYNTVYIFVNINKTFQRTLCISGIYSRTARKNHGSSVPVPVVTNSITKLMYNAC